jgi:hypothetical protein
MRVVITCLLDMTDVRLLAALNAGPLSGERGIGCGLAASDPSIVGATSIFRRRLPIQSEFSVLKSNLMAVPCIVAISSVNARVQLDGHFECCGLSAARRRAVNASFPQNEEPNDENEVSSGGAAACTVTRCTSHGSGANAGWQHSAAGNRGP